MMAEQVYIFFTSVIIGAIMGIIFDFFRALRRKGNTKNILVYIQDIIFWLIIAIIIIVSSFIINNGELRGYMLLGYILGAIIYMLVFSKYIKMLFGFVFDFVEKIFGYLMLPFEKLTRKLEKNNKNA
ncbi:MAG: spore cortex biosynthesis protein YabQ [Clostridia bacterium]|nr:spore cortex biosynthesis protein YabQ [Clostridia bacterium]